MANKRIFKILEKERQKLADYKAEITPKLDQPNLVLQPILLEKVANEILSYFFKDGKFTLGRVLTNPFKIGANILLYVELQKNNTLNLSRVVKGYRPPSLEK